MSADQTVQSILPLIKYHFIGEASHAFATDIDDITFTATKTSERRGATGKVLISTVYYECEFGELETTIALKFFQEKASALSELKNAMEFDIRFRTAPEFGIPRVIFSSTKDPILIIYEGIEGTNYDELNIDGKAEEAGRLLSTIHGATTRPVDTELYKNLMRMLGEHLSVLGREHEISRLLTKHFEKMEGAQSGTNPFSDFHQSNVMMSTYQNEILKAYVIDPEFAQKGSFDRMEDVGTFFGAQCLNEYLQTGNLTQSISDITEFFHGYNQKQDEMGGYKLSEMYKRGNPLGFFIAQWALMDALDYAINRGGDFQSKEVQQRVDFVIFLLQSVQFNFPNK